MDKVYVLKMQEEVFDLQDYSRINFNIFAVFSTEEKAKNTGEMLVAEDNGYLAYEVEEFPFDANYSS
jgi:hypothetical protein